jgi:hypothetical protein
MVDPIPRAYLDAQENGEVEAAAREHAGVFDQKAFLERARQVMAATDLSRLEPVGLSCPVTTDELFASIAISLKRIADHMEKHGSGW